MAISKELLELDTENLQTRTAELKATIAQDQIKLRTGALDNPAERTAHKRELARILTLITSKQRTAGAK
jgi:large subunit ribosomal protein L29